MLHGYMVSGGQRGGEGVVELLRGHEVCVGGETLFRGREMEGRNVELSL